MLNYIWAFMVILSIVYAAATGHLENCIQGGLNGAKDSITFIIGIAGVMSLWSGIMKIAETSGIISSLTKFLAPILNFLFPDLKEEHTAKKYIASNMIANILGLGNAATPLGLKAMSELDNINHHSQKASHAMCMFVVLNTASLQLIPTTMIAIRASLGSEVPFIIIPAVWFASICAVLAGIISVFIMKRLEKR